MDGDKNIELKLQVLGLFIFICEGGAGISCAILYPTLAKCSFKTQAISSGFVVTLPLSFKRFVGKIRFEFLSLHILLII